MNRVSNDSNIWKKDKGNKNEAGHQRLPSANVFNDSDVQKQGEENGTKESPLKATFGQRLQRLRNLETESEAGYQKTMLTTVSNNLETRKPEEESRHKEESPKETW